MTTSMVSSETGIVDILSKDALYSTISSAEENEIFRKSGLITRLAHTLIFPLSSIWRADHRAFLKREQWVGRELFWSTPFGDLRYPKQQQVRELFTRYNQKIVLEAGGKTLEMNCRVIETKGCPKVGALNHVVVQGNTSTLDNNMPGVYPLLEAYVKACERGELVAPARFILVNHYGNTVTSEEGTKDYYPVDLKAWGITFKNVLQTVVREYGSLHLLSGHSLGSIPVVECFKYMDDEEFLRLCPKTLFVAQGPSSLYEFSANMPVSFQWYPWGRFFLIGWVAYCFFKYLGWNIQLDRTLVERFKIASCQKQAAERIERLHIIVTSVVHDVFFPGKAGLCGSKKLDRLKGVVNLSRLTFNPPLSWGIPSAQHNYNIGWLQRQDLVKEELDYIDQHKIHLDKPEEIIRAKHKHDYALHHEESLVQAVLRSAWEELLGAERALA